MKKKNPAAVALAKKRAKSLSPERRSEIARAAAAAKWAGKTAAERQAGVAAANEARRKAKPDADLSTESAGSRNLAE